MGLYEAPQDEQHRALALLTTFGEELPRSALPALRCVSSADDAHDRLASFQVA